MLTFSLQSGSNGNCIYVEAGDQRLLFDAGISARQASLRMTAHGREIRDVDALILSHEHIDHIRGAAIFQRKFSMPVFCTQKTHHQTELRIGTLANPRYFVAGQTLTFGDVRVHTIRTPHDGVDAVCFVVEHGDRRLGIFTDLGHPFAGLRDALSAVDAAYLESNYDEEMLWNGTYSEWTKHRIAGSGGHLSNDEAADLAARCTKPCLKWLAVAHLSGENNTSDIALEALRRRVGFQFPVLLASRDGVSDVMEV